MSTCQYCDQARSVYAANCDGCSARHIARSMTAWNALHANGNGNRSDLTDMVNRMLARVEPKEARRMVLEWWRHDHQESRA